jgi:phosphatidylglycerophosphatase A
MRKYAAFIASLGGIGNIPVGSGTAGTACALVLCVFLPTSSFWYMGGVLIACIASIPICYAAEQYYAMEDDRRIIIDEVVGYMISIAFLPKTFWYFLGSFLLFRFFDIFKFYWIRKTQLIPHGIGVVLDDVLAGLVTNGILQVVHVFWVMIRH